MKLLFDQNISYRIVKKVSDKFSGCLHVSSCGLNDAEDSDIWSFAKLNNYTIVTSDSDFYDLALVRGIPPKIIWIREGNLSTSELANLLVQNHQIILSFMFGKEALEENACLEL